MPDRDDPPHSVYSIPKEVVALAAALLPGALLTAEPAEATPLPVYPGIGGSPGSSAIAITIVNVPPPPASATTPSGVPGSGGNGGCGSSTGTSTGGCTSCGTNGSDAW